MTVVITGASGQLGRALLSAAPVSARVVALTREALDLTDPAAALTCIQKHRPELIINAAAYTAVDRAEQDAESARAVNVGGAVALAEAAQSVGARFIQISTDFVFAGTASSPYLPDSNTQPLNTYGRTKDEAEKQVAAILGNRAVIVRTSWLYAPYGKNFVLTMLRLMKEKRGVRVVDDQIGTPTSVHSLAGALWTLAETPDVVGPLHWSDAGVASWYDFAVAIAEEGASLGIVPADVEVTPIATVEFPTPARRPPYSVLDKRSTVSALRRAPAHWRTNLRFILGEIARA